MQIEFRQMFPWSLLPYAPDSSDEMTQEDAADGLAHFRWLRSRSNRSRAESAKRADAVGWLIPSPVDVLMRPLRDVEAAAREEERLALIQQGGMAHAAGRGGDTLLLHEKAPWARANEVAFGEQWLPLFFPLGAGYLEFRLGWGVRIPRAYFLLILPLADLPGIETPAGLLDYKNLEHMNGDIGMGIALRPRQPVRLRRGQPLARALLVHGDTIRVPARFEKTR